MMKIFALAVFMATVFVSPTYAADAQPAQADVLYMNHGPLRSVIRKLQDIFDKYGDKVTVAWYDFDKKESDDIKNARGIKIHTPCVIWINGSHTYKIGDNEVTFIGFPSGFGPAQFQGKWTFEDLEAVLDSVTSGKK